WRPASRPRTRPPGPAPPSPTRTSRTCALRVSRGPLPLALEDALGLLAGQVGDDVPQVRIHQPVQVHGRHLARVAAGQPADPLHQVVRLVEADGELRPDPPLPVATGAELLDERLARLG